ncbi:hypothetical protein [Actinosynnema sp.]|uniref:hypothetical protein n=1 Tax=Actinosynnema sp. TaxID=1872144 RepID=UPI003F843F55
MPEELWTRDQVAQELGIKVDGVRHQMRRWGVEAVGREPGRGGSSLYPAAKVRAAHADRPGAGNHTRGGNRRGGPAAAPGGPLSPLRRAMLDAVAHGQVTRTASDTPRWAITAEVSTPGRMAGAVNWLVEQGLVHVPGGRGTAAQLTEAGQQRHTEKRG